MEANKKKRVIGIVGPTASGKTALSLPVAQSLKGEILCMDSMQVYRRMDIGTAKPTKGEQALVPHHLMDIREPGDSFTVTQYSEEARKVLESVSVPILVGGTGLYLQALSQPMDYGTVSGDEEIRRKYHEIADTQGNEALHAILKRKDPVSAAKLHPNDVRRVVRALEVFDLTGQPLSRQAAPDPDASEWDFRLYAVDWPRETLYHRVDRRVDAMIRDGLPDEVEALLRSGVSPDCQAMQGLGYKELIPVLAGEMTLEDAVSLIKLRTRHYAKRQLTWFQRDSRVVWLPAEGETAASLANKIIELTGENAQ